MRTRERARSFFYSRIFLSMLLTGLMGAASSARAGMFLDLSSFNAGTIGSFTGTLGGVTAVGLISSPSLLFQFNIIDTAGTYYGGSTINNSSPQYSYSSVYTPTIAATDRVGYSMAGPGAPATIQIGFTAPITDPVFHVANLDDMQYDFSGTSGLGGLVLLSGNGGGGDGLAVTGMIIDAKPSTLVGVDPNSPPPLTGDRSAYGSVQILGTFTLLNIRVSDPNAVGDSGSFTLSVPEPTSLGLCGMGAIGLLRRRRGSK